MELLHSAMWHDHDNDFARRLHPAMWLWNHDKWIHQVAAPCNVIRGYGMTCRWICPMSAPSNMTQCSSGIMALNSPGGSTLHCGRWLWDDMPFNLHKHPPYWNSISGFNFDHITPVDMSLCTSLWNLNRTTLSKKNDVMSIFKMADLSNLGF